MDRVLISWNVPNLITIWLMLFIGLFLLALGSQFVLGRVNSSNSGPANNSGSY